MTREAVARAQTGRVRVPSVSWLRVPAFLLTLASLAEVLAFFQTSFWQPAVVAASVAAVSLPLAVAGLAAALLARHRVVAFFAALLTMISAGAQTPLFVGADHVDGITVTVMTANLRLGRASPAAVVAAVRRHGAGVVMLEELTPQLRDALKAAGLDRALPYKITEPGGGARGVGLWSRWPLTAKVRGGQEGVSLVRAQMRIRGVAGTVAVAAVHLSAPWPEDPRDWRGSLAALQQTIEDAGTGHTIIGGDFNATYGNRQFRLLLRNGTHDAAEQAGAGWTRTFPADRSYPPLVGIDHILVRDAVAQHVETVTLSGSDHRAVVARLHIGDGIVT